jgi:hypothetical protein
VVDIERGLSVPPLMMELDTTDVSEVYERADTLLQWLLSEAEERDASPNKLSSLEALLASSCPEGTRYNPHDNLDLPFPSGLRYHEDDYSQYITYNLSYPLPPPEGTPNPPPAVNIPPRELFPLSHWVWGMETGALQQEVWESESCSTVSLDTGSEDTGWEATQ